MNFNDWFDIYNKQHIEAYRRLQNEGVWPLGFIPKTVNMESGWNGILLNRLAEAWTSHIMNFVI